jgi:hypothetical protein
MKKSIRPDHDALAEALRHRVLEAPGETDATVRRAVAERAAGGASAEAAFDDLARQIGESADRVSDAQVAGVRAATGSDKAAFEIIAAAALGAGLLRWRQGIKALQEAIDAPE